MTDKKIVFLIFAFATYSYANWKKPATNNRVADSHMSGGVVSEQPAEPSPLTEREIIANDDAATRAESIEWATWAEAEQHAGEGAIVWVHHAGRDCLPCEQLERNVFPKKEVIQSSRKFVCLRLVDQGQAWGVGSYPADIFVGPGWKVFGRASCPTSAAAYVEHLDRWAKKMRE